MALTPLERKYLLTLCAEDVFGYSHIDKLYTQYKSFEEVYRSNTNQWSTISKQTRDRWEIQKKNLEPEKVIQKLQASNAKFICYYDDEYPQILREIPSPPVILYYLGSLDVLTTKSLAIVGTRMISSYGQQVVDTFVPQLVSAELTITSGFQRGVDQAAHKAALHAGGKTIAVLGTGVDVDYPTNSRSLKEKIIQSGSLIVSEYPPGTVGFKANFPRRNRIVSGLSLGVLVVEAALKSGSMITPRFALDQNRDIFAVPGSIFSLLSEGPHHLIQQGGKCVYSALDILSELNLTSVPQEPYEPVFENELQKGLFEEISRMPRSMDDLSATLNISVELVSIELTLLELQGAINKNADGTYSRTRMN